MPEQRRAAAPDTGAAAYWDEVAASWVSAPGTLALRRYSDAVARRLLERWLPAHAHSLLKTDAFDEVAGEGLLELLTRRARAVAVVDHSQRLVGALQERHPYVETAIADVRELPFAEGAFDVVVSLSTLDHFAHRSEIATALAELARVLRPGGTLIVTLDNGANPLVALRNALPPRLLRALRLVPYDTGATIGPSGLRDAVARSGLDVEAETATMHVPRLLVRATRWRRLGPLLACERLGDLPTRALSGQFVAVRARKPLSRSARPGRRQKPPLVARALSATVYRSLALFELELAQMPAAVEPALPLELGFVESGSVAELAGLRPDLAELAPARLARGDRCFAARHEGRILAVRWVARGSARIDFLRTTLPLADDEAYNFDTWSDPAARGLGVAAATGAALYRTLAGEGVRRVVRAVWPYNAGGMRNVQREGFRHAGSLVGIGLGPLRICLVRRR